MTNHPSCGSYLLLGEQGCADHFHLDGNQSQGLKRQAPPVPVVVLKNKKIGFAAFQTQSSRAPTQPGFLSLQVDKAGTETPARTGSGQPRSTVLKDLLLA